MTQHLRRHWPWLLLLLAGTSHAAEFIADPPHGCDQCDAWSKPREPFRIFANTWFVGGGLSSILITSDKGHVLIDGGLTQSAPQIAANIQKLGFRLEDVKFILNSHTHYDHAGGIAALQRASHAQVVASPASKRALERGAPTEDDPQFGFGPAHNNFPAVTKVRTIADGETLQVGDIHITAHFSPGHTPGGTTWTWNSCQADNCMSMVYADSLNSISAPGFRFTADANLVKNFEKSIDTVAGLTCGILLTPHPEAFDLDAKLASRARDPHSDPFFDRSACAAYAAGARERLAKRLADERATP